MKKSLILLIVLTLFVLNSCFYSQEKVEITIEGDVASPSFPIKIGVNLDNYELKFFDENNNEIKYKNDGNYYYFLNLKEGKNIVFVQVFSKKKKVSEKKITIYFDNTPPDIAFLNYFIKSGELYITASSPATDLKNFVLENAKEKYNFNINLKIPLKKNMGIIKYNLYAVDTYNNKSKTKVIEINTNNDEKPKILNTDLKIALFGKTNIKISDDWTPVENLKVLLKTDRNSYSLINIDEVLSEESKVGTLIVIDNGDNYTEKKVNIELERNIPSMAKGNPRLIDFSVDTFGWDYETDVESYIVETPYDYGWKQELETKAAYARITDSNVAMIRKKSKFGTLSFPSRPTIRFSGTFVHLVRNILDSSEENLYLPQINSEFLIGGQTILGEKSIVMVESGSILKFVSNSKLVIKGLFFIMPGAGKSLISGNGEIIVDGGIFIASKTIFDKVRIVGNNAKLIYLEDSEFLEGSDLLSVNDFRICLYNTLGYKSNLNLHNAEEIYIKESTFNTLNLQNVNILKSDKSSFVNLNINGLSKIFLNKTNIKNIKQDGFSWSKIINSNVEKINISDYSRSEIFNTNITTISTNTSVVIQ
ncbi:hypothetical protein SAMN02745164_00453 [Marinitoga hydrogenitolerans DSM 16785]|uniref:Uncharacterized protein n=1 Tax=Marinitoga hydrogenitolerans (strain DSM 16785 / JCM 12826 / AT1271) TaxID=1122195 RepID=A0A1M4TJE4_MARH1|nr:hypothetical protein [Marinitoga hydrogenitolerans]SHE44407.1 hypothetical protein SAMN02745164_00453 [Marinitoga hydrogenitolerans DSM 16785]